MKRLLFTLLLGFSPLAPIFADEPPSESRAAAAGKVLWESPESTIKLAVEDEPTQVTLDVPALSVGSKPVVLRFRARFQWPTLGGFGANLGISLNDTALGPENGPVVNRDRIELTTNRPLPPQGNGWWMRNKGWSLVLHYSPDPGALDQHISSDTAEGQWYLVQIDGALNSSGANQLILTNNATTATWEDHGKIKDRAGIIIEHLSIVELENLP